jgi:hypothetical protein
MPILKPRLGSSKHWVSPETFLKSNTSKSSTSTPDLVTDGKDSGTSAPLSSVCNDTLDNIDPLLLTSAPAPDTPIRATVHDIIDVDDLTGIDEGESHLAEVIWSAKYNGATQSTC